MSKARSIPGESVSARLFGRDRRRAHVGPSQAFFHRFGVQDPFSVTSPRDGAERARSEDPGAWVYLSSQAYHEDVSTPRYRLLRRALGTRSADRLGERLRSGPAAIEPRAMLRTTDADLPVLVDPPEVIEAPVEQAPPRRRSRAAGRPRRETAGKPTPSAWAPFPGASGRDQEKRAIPPATSTTSSPTVRRRLSPPSARPVARAYQRAPAAGPARRALDQVLEALHGPRRQEIEALLRHLATAPGGTDVGRARRALRRFGGTPAVAARGTAGLEPVRVRAGAVRDPAGSDVAAEPDRPVDRALGRVDLRGARAATAAGLRPVLAASPAVLATVEERPERGDGPTAAADQHPRSSAPRADRRVPRTPGTRSSRTAARGGSGAPTGVSGAEVSRAPATGRRRSVQPASARAVERLAGASRGSSSARGAAAIGRSEPVHGTERVTRRADAASSVLGLRPVVSDRSPISGAPLAWLRAVLDDAPAPPSDAASVGGAGRGGDRPTARSLARRSEPGGRRGSTAPIPYVQTRTSGDRSGADPDRSSPSRLRDPVARPAPRLRPVGGEHDPARRTVGPQARGLRSEAGAVGASRAAEPPRLDLLADGPTTGFDEAPAPLERAARRLAPRRATAALSESPVARSLTVRAANGVAPAHDGPAASRSGEGRLTTRGGAVGPSGGPEAPARGAAERWRPAGARPARNAAERARPARIGEERALLAGPVVGARVVGSEEALGASSEPTSAGALLRASRRGEERRSDALGSSPVAPTRVLPEPEPSVEERRPRRRPTRRSAERAEVRVRLDARGRPMLAPVASAQASSGSGSGSDRAPRAVSSTLSASARGLVQTGESVVPRRALDWSALLPELLAIAVPEGDGPAGADAADSGRRARGGGVAGRGPRAGRPGGPRSQPRSSGPARPGEAGWHATSPAIERATRLPFGSARGGAEGTSRPGGTSAVPPQIFAWGHADSGAPGGSPDRTGASAEPGRTRRASVHAAGRGAAVARSARPLPSGSDLTGVASAAGERPAGAARRAPLPQRLGLLASPDDPAHAPTSARPVQGGGGSGHPEEGSTGWARRAGPPQVRTAGGLLPALARAGDPEELVRLILERSDGLGRGARELPGEAQSLIQRIVRAADPASAEGGAGPRRTPGAPEVQTLTRVRTVTRTRTTSVPTPALRGLRAPAAGASADSANGVGASGVMKLAGKLMKLIHLAEAERRKADAQRQVRMAEDSADARSEGGAGQPGGESINDKSMNIATLREDVLQAVLRELEMMRWRREDGDGPNSWS